MKTIESDIDYCKKAILHGSLSFHAASLALPESVRTPCLALYAFCRLADDEVDLKQDKSASIYDLVQRLDLVYAGTPRNHPMDRAFANMVEKFDMPRALPEALFEGFVWDAMSKQYKTFDEYRTATGEDKFNLVTFVCLGNYSGEFTLKIGTNNGNTEVDAFKGTIYHGCITSLEYLGKM